MQQKNFLLFIVVSFLLFLLWMEVSKRIWPPPPRPAPRQMADEDDKGKQPPRRPALQAALGPIGGWPGLMPPPPARPALQAALGPIAALLGPNPPHKKVPGIVEPAITPEAQLHTLGAPERASPFYLRVKLDPRGGSVRSVLLNKFQKIDDRGRPVWEDETRKVPAPLELVPDDANLQNQSFLLFHFDPDKVTDDRPLDTLGKRRWILDNDADERHATFSTELTDLGLKITKTYTLAERDYHIGLEVKVERKSGDQRELPFRYQLTGAHGLPVEGEWYTSTFRNVLIAREDHGSIDRELDDLQISHRAGGKPVFRSGSKFIRYAGVAVQYFASVIVVDNDQKHQDFLARARPSLEKTVTKGVIKSVDPERGTFELIPQGGGKEMTFHLPPGFVLLPREGQRLAVIHYADSELRQLVIRLDDEARTQPLWIDDVTVRVATEPDKIKVGEPIVHKYLLYNGPVKPSLLRQQPADAEVPPAVIDRYVDKLHLNTLTDYHTPGWLGSFANAIYFTSLVIFFTNLMHWVLGLLHIAVPSYGICIILLTVMVRGMMFPLSRKQAMTSIRMQALAPELKKLGEKYKDDPQAKAMAQMALYKKHGVNIYGSCWMLFLQMPIFMGLYFALQESIYFRGASFWPTWIKNLSAPDMLIGWGQSIPWISRPEDYGGFLYLGPYFNLLPVIAVALMIFQQKLMTPPPTDEQQEMQQKMMKYMMIVMGLMFYKVAAGLCIYFIASSIWGFTERKLLPKLKHKVVTADEMVKEMVDRPPGAASSDSTAVAAAPGGSITDADDRNRKGKLGRNKKKEKAGRASGKESEESKSAIGRLRQRLSNWWAEVLKQAENKRQAERKK